MFTRPITIIGLIQTVTIVLGFIALGSLMKSLGWGTAEVTFRFSSLATFLREYSMALLVVPIAWTLAASWILSRDGDSSRSRAILILGAILCAAFLVAYLMAIVAPGYQPMLISR